MKYFLISAVILLMGCSMPGVGELEERVDDLETTTAYDDSDIVEQVDQLEVEVEIIDERVTALEMGDVAEIREISIPDSEPEDEVEPDVTEPVILTVEDIVGLQDSMDVLRTGLSDSIAVLDLSIESLVLSLDNLTMENDSLKVDLADLRSQIDSLSTTVEDMRYTGTSSSTSTSAPPGRGR